MNRSRILFDARWVGPHGIGRFAEQVQMRISGLTELQTTVPLFHPLDPIALTVNLLQHRPAVFFTPGFNAPLFERVPLVLTVHDLNYVQFRENSDPLRRAYFHHLVRPACRRAYRVLTVSEYSRQQIIGWTGVEDSDVVNVGCGVDDRFRPEGRSHDIGAPYLFMVANERPHKNIERTLKAYAVSGLGGDVKLLIAGKISKPASDLIRRLGLESCIELAGYIADAELPAVYRGALGLCMPSLFEGFGLPLVEAMACGTPVLTSNSTALPEVAGDAAILVEAHDVDSIAGAMRMLVEDQDLRLKLKERGLARSRQYSWNVVADKIQDVLRAAAG